MFYGFLADLLGIVHLAYVSFVVVGQVLILIGMGLRWRWIRDLRFRAIHLAMILIVALESIGEMMCPLTTWENDLRALAGQPVVGDSFVANLLNHIMFSNDIGNDHWIFRSGYVAFAALVVMTWIMAPPRRRFQGAPESLNRGKLVTCLLGSLGFIFLYTAVSMEAYKKSWDDWREDEYRKTLLERGGEAAKPDAPVKEDRLPVYLMTFTGVNFVGLALLCCGLRPPGGTAAVQK